MRRPTVFSFLFSLTVLNNVWLGSAYLPSAVPNPDGLVLSSLKDELNTDEENALLDFLRKGGFCRINDGCTTPESLTRFNLASNSFLHSIEGLTAVGRKEKLAEAQRQVLDKIVDEYDQFFKLVNDSDFACVLERCILTLKALRNGHKLQQFIKDGEDNEGIWNVISIVQYWTRKALTARGPN